mgnify:CR=1 FL=1
MAPRPHASIGERGVSPAVGVVLLVAIAVVLAAGAGALVFGLTDEQPPAPTAKLSLEPVEGTSEYQLVHESGDRIDGDRVTLRGVADPDTLAGRELTAGRTVSVTPRAETVTVVWRDDSDASSYVLTEFAVDPDSVVDVFAAGTVFTGRASGVVAVEGDGGSATTVPGTTDVAAMGGLGADVSGDGTGDIPYVDTGGTVRIVDADGDSAALATSSDISGSVATAKTRLTTGTWQGSPPSVFFVDQNHDTLYRVAPGGTPQVVATPGNGAQSVTGIGDIDGDGTDELVFADGSQQLRYLEPSGTIRNVDDGQTGSNNGIGAGSLVDFDGDGTVAVVAVDGSNDIKINRRPSGGGTTILSGPNAAKAPVTTADVDGDDAPEIVYVASSGDLRYVDDPLGSPSTATLTDTDGNAVSGSDETGAT